MSDLKAAILQLTREYSRQAHRANLPVDGLEREKFIPGVTQVPFAARVFTDDEVVAAVSSALDFWLTLGKEGDAFEKALAEYLDVTASVLCNSGSSANLLAISALSSYSLGSRRLKRGDEVITAAAGFPTTIAPIVQNGFVPVFVDSDPITLNVKPDQLELAYSSKTKAVILAHTLGNPFNLTEVVKFCREKGLFLIEDNCDSLGSRYGDRFTGSFGDLSTQSFYPPHHITMGEGGAVNVVSEPKLKTIVASFRDWGRHCWCASGHDNTCGKRFDWKLGSLPRGYDHKNTYSHLGYNLKPLDTQAAIGRVQLARLPCFIKARMKNWEYLRSHLDQYSYFFDFMLPTHAREWSPSGFAWDASGQHCECSYFGFMLLLKPDCQFTKFELARYLEDNKIQNRMLFGGNIVRQPMIEHLVRDYPAAVRIVGDLEGADALMNRSLWIGVYPGLTTEMLDYMVDKIRIFIECEA